MRVPKRHVPTLVAAIVAGLMTFVVSGISTWRGVGIGGEMWSAWMTSWGISWVIAFPLLYVLRPFVVRFVDAFVAD